MTSSIVANLNKSIPKIINYFFNNMALLIAHVKLLIISYFILNKVYQAMP